MCINRGPDQPQKNDIDDLGQQAVLMCTNKTDTVSDRPLFQGPGESEARKLSTCAKQYPVCSPVLCGKDACCECLRPRVFRAATLIR